MEAIKQSLEEISVMFNTKMAQFQEELHKPAPATNTVASLAADFAAFKKFVVTALSALQKQVELISNDCEMREMRSRRKFLLLHGVAESSGEDTTALAVSTFTEHIDLVLSHEHISRSFRLGQSQNSKPRPLLVKFRDVSNRDNIWRAKTSFKGSGITISEFLTKARHDLFMTARQCFGVSKCWTRDGYIFVIDADDKRHRITSVAELEKISTPLASGMPAATAPKPQGKPKKRTASSKK